jgi:hypothetical protein
VEYAINLALVAIAVIATMRILGPRRGNTFNVISDSLPGRSDGGPIAVATEAPTEPPPAVIEGDAARAQYCAERPGWVGGVNWRFAGGHT